MSRTLPPEYHSWINRKEGSGYYGVMGSVGGKYLDYHRVITAMDQQIGRLLSELERLGIADNTIVVYTSDNGYFWGEKQLIDKRFPYEEATRIPLIVRYPAKIKNPGQNYRGIGPQYRSGTDTPGPGRAAGSRDHAGNESWPHFKRAMKTSRIALPSIWNTSKIFPTVFPEWDAVRTDRFLYVEYRKSKKRRSFSISKRTPAPCITSSPPRRGKSFCRNCRA